MPDNFPHDAAYKEFFSNPDMVKSLLLDFVSEDFVKHFDFDTLEECSGSYITSDLRQRHNDIVWRVRFRNNWCYIYILLEFQSSQDYWMALRILSYTALLWESLIKQGILKAGDKLPPIFPIVLYNGESRWKSAENIQALITPIHDKLLDYQPKQKYFLIDENRISDLLLDKAIGESAYIFRLERAKSAAEILAIAHGIATQLKDPKYDYLRRSIYSWIVRLMEKRPDKFQQAELAEDAVMLEQRIAQWEADLMQKGFLLGEEKGKAKGRAEGKLEGWSKGRAEGKLEGWSKGRAEGKLEGKNEGRAEVLGQQKATLLEMLLDRFGEIPKEWEKAVNVLDEPMTVNRLMRSIYKVNSAQEFGELLFNNNI